MIRYKKWVFDDFNNIGDDKFWQSIQYWYGIWNILRIKYTQNDKIYLYEPSTNIKVSKVKVEALYKVTCPQKIIKSRKVIFSSLFDTLEMCIFNRLKISMDQNILLFCICSILSIIISSKNRSLMVNLDCSSITKHYIISPILYSLYINSYI